MVAEERGSEASVGEYHETQQPRGGTTPALSRTSTEDTRRSNRPLEPPVTKATLSELDVGKIIHNPKLRHDINFDPELHFRPNLDGEKGRRKQDKAAHFWGALEQQLVEFVLDRSGFHAKYGNGDDWCLPALLKAAKEIIQTLVPSRDRGYIEEGLNVELLMQQFNRGVADLEKLASWLSQVLKSHCAPMRDEWVDETYGLLSAGNRENDIPKLVKGMRFLLSVLEAMKLDVANHQIRCLRPVLIEDTVQFEKQYFQKRMSGGKMQVDSAKAWYQRSKRLYSGAAQANATSFGKMGIFFEGLVELLLQTSHEALPNTLQHFDDERLQKLRADIDDCIRLEICMKAYEELEANNSGFGRFLDLTTSDFNFNSSPANSRPSSLCLLTPPGSRPSSLVLSQSGSAHSSNRNSSLTGVPTSSQNPAKARELYNSLGSLLSSSSARHNLRWEALAPSMALQVFRFAHAPNESLEEFERTLTAQLKTHSNRYRDVEQMFADRLMADLGTRVKEFRGLSGVSLFGVATGERKSGGRRDFSVIDRTFREAREDGSIEDIATRVAHLGVLHWKVWGDVIYELDE